MVALCWGYELWGTRASVAAACGLGSCGSWAQEYRHSSCAGTCAVCGVFWIRDRTRVFCVDKQVLCLLSLWGSHGKSMTSIPKNRKFKNLQLVNAKLHYKTETAGWQTDLKSKERQALPKEVELEVEISFNTQALTLAK